MGGLKNIIINLGLTICTNSTRLDMFSLATPQTMERVATESIAVHWQPRGRGFTETIASQAN